MTDTEIIKSLECCQGAIKICDECPIRDECEGDPFSDTRGKYALALINRQKAEIETWKESFNNLDKIARPNLAFVETAKKQAVREFAKKLEHKSELMALSVYAEPRRAVFIDDINNLVKEMVGEDNA